MSQSSSVARAGRRSILLIGGAGLVGLHIADAVRDQLLAVTHHRSLVPGGLTLNITDSAAAVDLIAQVRPEVIILAAAEAHVERCEREPVATRQLNVDAARVIAEVARRIGALMVVFSSEYVFDGKRGRYTEDDAVCPINEYGRQKVDLEALAREVPRHIICRTSGVFGWEVARKNFVCQVVDTLRAGREFPVPSDQVITATYARDLARAVRGLIEHEATGIFHVVGPRILPRLELAELVCRVFALPQSLVAPRPTRELSYIAPRPLGAGLADDRLRTVLGAPLRDPAIAIADMRATEPSSASGDQSERAQS